MKIEVLGVKYNLILNAIQEDYPILKEADGATDTSIKRILIAKMEKNFRTLEDLRYYQNKVLRHELIHAFLYESGLSVNSEWASNEEIVDWIAIQFPKLFEIFSKNNIL